MPRDRRPLFILPLAALIAIAPLIVRGCSCGHDFDFYLINWFEAARQLTRGNFHPQWADTPAWNAGEPRFVFYPPLSWTIGALLTLGLTHLPGIAAAHAFALAPILYTWLVLSGGGFSLYALAGRYANPLAAT